MKGKYYWETDQYKARQHESAERDYHWLKGIYDKKGPNGLRELFCLRPLKEFDSLNKEEDDK